VKTYIVLYAWKEHSGNDSYGYEWRYYWEQEKMKCWDINDVPTSSESTKNKDLADQRLQEIITRKEYSIMDQKVDFSGYDAYIVEGRLDLEGKQSTWELKDNQWRAWKILPKKK
jgi:hypothetical protein